MLVIEVRFGGDIMPMAYVLLTTESGAVKEVIDALKKIESVKETYMV